MPPLSVYTELRVSDKVVSILEQKNDLTFDSAGMLLIVFGF